MYFGVSWGWGHCRLPLSGPIFPPRLRLCLHTWCFLHVTRSCFEAQNTHQIHDPINSFYTSLSGQPFSTWQKPNSWEIEPTRVSVTPCSYWSLCRLEAHNNTTQSIKLIQVRAFLTQECKNRSIIQGTKHNMYTCIKYLTPASVNH